MQVSPTYWRTGWYQKHRSHSESLYRSESSDKYAETYPCYNEHGITVKTRWKNKPEWSWKSYSPIVSGLAADDDDDTEKSQQDAIVQCFHLNHGIWRCDSKMRAQFKCDRLSRCLNSATAVKYIRLQVIFLEQMLSCHWSSTYLFVFLSHFQIELTCYVNHSPLRFFVSTKNQTRSGVVALERHCP